MWLELAFLMQDEISGTDVMELLHGVRTRSCVLVERTFNNIYYSEDV